MVAEVSSTKINPLVSPLKYPWRQSHGFTQLLVVWTHRCGQKGKHHSDHRGISKLILHQAGQRPFLVEMENQQGFTCDHVLLHKRAWKQHQKSRGIYLPFSGLWKKKKKAQKRGILFHCPFLDLGLHKDLANKVVILSTTDWPWPLLYSLRL